MMGVVVRGGGMMGKLWGGRIKPPAPFVLEYWNERKDKDKRDYYGTNREGELL